jgi:phosphoglycerol transferase MdoB-like AlkP superfamily enzyme
MIETLTSQIDIAPTVLGMLGLEYEAPFFGSNVLACGVCERIALFSHNHDVAVYRDGKLAVLGLGKSEQTLAYDRSLDRYSSIAPDRELTDLTVAIYQTAYEQFQARKYE